MLPNEFRKQLTKAMDKFRKNVELANNNCIFCNNPPQGFIFVYPSEVLFENIITGMIIMATGGLHKVCKDHMFTMCSDRNTLMYSVISYGLPN